MACAENPGTVQPVNIPMAAYNGALQRLAVIRDSLYIFLKTRQEKRCEIPSKDELCQFLRVCREDFETCYRVLLKQKRIELVNDRLVVH